jgi:uncharacterized protein (TIGR02466 family)
MPVKPWFPTQIYESRLLSKDDDAFRGRLLVECRKIREQDDSGRLWCQEHYPSGYTSYGTLRNLNRTAPPFEELERKVWPHVARFARALDLDLREVNLAMTDCWVNIMANSAVHPLHAHPGALISGTFYLDTPDGCAAIEFEDPRREKFVNVPRRRADCRPANRQRVAYEVKAGKLILFESWLMHGVAPNEAADERISVSFNYTWV